MHLRVTVELSPLEFELWAEDVEDARQKAASMIGIAGLAHYGTFTIEECPIEVAEPR